jgi:hypothetical protein
MKYKIGSVRIIAVDRQGFEILSCSQDLPAEECVPLVGHWTIWQASNDSRKPLF